MAKGIADLVLRSDGYFRHALSHPGREPGDRNGLTAGDPHYVGVQLTK
jgi:hypothetical protein